MKYQNLDFEVDSRCFKYFELAVDARFFKRDGVNPLLLSTSLSDKVISCTSGKSSSL